MGSYLGRDAILKAAALRTGEVHVPEWMDQATGSDVVLVREMRGRERDEWEASLAVQRGGQMVPDTANMRAKLAAMSIIGEDGEPLFTQRDVAALGELSAAALQRVYDVAARLSGLNQSALEELGKTSEEAPGDSTSDSPASSDAPSKSSSAASRHRNLPSGWPGTRSRKKTASSSRGAGNGRLRPAIARHVSTHSHATPSSRCQASHSGPMSQIVSSQPSGPMDSRHRPDDDTPILMTSSRRGRTRAPGRRAGRRSGP